MNNESESRLVVVLRFEVLLAGFGTRRRRELVREFVTLAVRSVYPTGSASSACLPSTRAALETGMRSGPEGDAGDSRSLEGCA